MNIHEFILLTFCEHKSLCNCSFTSVSHRRGVRRMSRSIHYASFVPHGACWWQMMPQWDWSRASFTVNTSRETLNGNSALTSWGSKLLYFKRFFHIINIILSETFTINLSFWCKRTFWVLTTQHHFLISLEQLTCEKNKMCFELVRLSDFLRSNYLTNCK